MQDQQWPKIRQDLVYEINSMKATIEAFKLVAIEKEKSYTAMTIEFQKIFKSHNDALFGYRDDNGKWVKGLIQIVQDNDNARKEEKHRKDKIIGWLIVGIFSAVGLAIVDVAGKFWRFITGQH